MDIPQILAPPPSKLCSLIKEKDVSYMHRQYSNIAAILFLFVNMTGCSTLQSTAHYTLGSPKLYSGTRMDIDTINESEDYVLKKYNVAGPENPKLDLPFSFLLDTAIIPVVLPVFFSDALFE